MLFLARRRAGLTQKEFADAMEIPVTAYKRLERKGYHQRYEVSPAPIDDLTEIEECVLLRRRYGMSCVQLADALRVSRFWVNMMELGLRPHHTLVAYWRSRDA